MNKLMTLTDVLESANKLPWNQALYLPASRNWSLDSPAIVWNPDDIADEDNEIPEVVAQHGMIYVLAISAVQDVVSNVEQQKANCSTREKFDALMHYFQHDCFLNLP